MTTLPNEVPNNIPSASRWNAILSKTQGVPGAADANVNFPQFFAVRNYGATGNGSTDDSPYVVSANAAAIAAGGGILYFASPGNYKFGTSTNLGNAQVGVMFAAGATVTVANGVTLTISGPLIAPPYTRIFYLSGTGVVTLGRTSTDAVYPEWWGADSSGAVDSAGAFNLAIAQAASIRAPVVATGPNYLWSSTVTVLAHAKLKLGDSTIRHGADVNLCNIKPWGRVLEGNFDTTGGTFTHACVLFDGSDRFWATSGRNAIIGTRFNGSLGVGTGTAVFLDSEHPTSGYIYGVYGSELRINGYEYGIRLYRTGAAGVNFCNGNSFSHVWANGTVNLISLTQSGGYAGDNDANRFEDIDIEFGAGGLPSTWAITCGGRYNYFKIHIWDQMPVAQAIRFLTNANGNRLEWDQEAGTSVLDNGYNNTVIATIPSTLKVTNIDAASGLLMTGGGNLSFSPSAKTGIVMPSVAGAPSDSNFANPQNGMLAVDTSNHFLYFRAGSTWLPIPAGSSALMYNGGYQFIRPASLGNAFLEFSFLQLASPSPGIEVNWDVNTGDRMVHLFSPTVGQLRMIRDTVGGTLKPLQVVMVDTPNAYSKVSQQWNTDASSTMFNNNLLPDSGTKAGIGIRSKAGVPTDADFSNPVDGLLCVDSTDGRLYIRYGGTWHYANLT